MRLCACGLSFSTVEGWSAHVGQCWQAQQVYKNEYDKPMVKALTRLSKVLEKLEKKLA